MALSVKIEKKLGDFCLNVEFETNDGVMSLLGASGCGKSMTLKCIAGIEKPDQGRIVLDGVVLFDSEKKIHLPPQKRKVGYLFQQYALFPNMTVEENIACGVPDRSRRKATVAKMIQVMNLSGLEKLRPCQLSGGQQQRAALARILANEPEVLLLDEPFSALDSYLRFQLEREVQDMIWSFGKTVVLVSHDRDEVFRLTDRVAIMKDGHLETVGEKTEVFRNPRTRNGARLTGCRNVSSARMADSGHVYAEDWGLLLHTSEEVLGEDQNHIQYVGIHSRDLKIGMNNHTENSISCKVQGIIENPFSYTVILQAIQTADKNREISSRGFEIELEKEKWKQVAGEEVTVYFPPQAIMLLKE